MSEVQLNFVGWLAEEELKTQKAIHQLEMVMGKHDAEANPTVNMLRGYLRGVRVSLLEYENRMPPMPKPPSKFPEPTIEYPVGSY